MKNTWQYPTFIAHRGAGKTAPENTLAAFKLGLSHGFTMFECDVKLSADGTAFLLHDDTLDRTTNAQGDAGLWAWRDLAQLDAGAWHSHTYHGEPLLTLNTLAAWVQANQAMINLEIKPSPHSDTLTGAAVASRAAQLWQGAGVLPLLSSFSETALAAAYAAQPTLPRAWLVEAIPSNWQETLSRLGCVAMVCEVSQLTQLQVAAIKAAGYRVCVYTCNDAQQAAQCLSWGVDSIITDCLAFA